MGFGAVESETAAPAAAVSAALAESDTKHSTKHASGEIRISMVMA